MLFYRYNRKFKYLIKISYILQEFKVDARALLSSVALERFRFLVFNLAELDFELAYSF